MVKVLGFPYTESSYGGTKSTKTALRCDCARVARKLFEVKKEEYCGLKLVSTSLSRLSTSATMI